MDREIVMTHSLLARENLPEEQRRIRARCFHPSGTFVEFAKDEIEQSIAGRFEKIAQRYADARAIKSRTQTLTYDELNRAANRVAHALLERRGPANEPVALLLENDAPMTVAILGALKAGKIYVPLDSSYPHASLAYILEDTGAAVVVTNDRNLPAARALARAGLECINLDELGSSFPAANPGLDVSPENPVYILYTSGSTGKPKGVVHNHRNVLREIRSYTNAVHIGAADRLALLSSPSFADSVRTTYGALLNGAGLYPFDVREEGPARLPEWMIREGITIYRSVPAVFRRFAGALAGETNFPELRAIYSAGDTVAKGDIELYREHFSPQCIFVNGLGASECLTFCWQFIDKESRISSNTVPVGHAIEDMEVFLLGDDGEKVGFDQPGEIMVRSRYLSPGYWRKPELTGAAFSAGADGARIYRTGDLGRMAPDGCLEHLGRKDFQIKIRGHRIEAGAIETALLALDEIKEAVVVARADGAGDGAGKDPRLTAYLVPRRRPGPPVDAIRRALREKLPDYMIPAVFVVLDSLPLTANRKIDRRALPAPGRTRPELETAFAAPRSGVEKNLAAIWQSVLGLERIGARDEFLDLGGDSLLATQVISRIGEAYEIELSMRSFFEASTIAGLAAVIERAVESGARKPAPRIAPIVREPLKS